MSAKSQNDTRKDSQAFALELTKHQAPMLAFIRSLLPPGADPRDLLQDVNITLWKKQDDYSLGTNFKAWAFKVARYHVLHYFRGIKKNNCLVFDENLIEIISAHAEESIDSDSLESRRNALQTCLETLPSNDRQLIKIRYTNHMTINAYAESKNLNPASLRGSLRNIRKALAKCVRFRLAQENFA